MSRVGSCRLMQSWAGWRSRALSEPEVTEIGTDWSILEGDETYGILLELQGLSVAVPLCGSSSLGQEQETLQIPLCYRRISKVQCVLLLLPQLQDLPWLPLPSRAKSGRNWQHPNHLNSLPLYMMSKQIQSLQQPGAEYPKV
jgi:hypothetical protein